MTIEEFNRLSPLEKAAVLFEAMRASPGFGKIDAAEEYGAAIFNALSDLNNRVKNLEERLEEKSK